MTVSIRSVALAGLCAQLAACQGQQNQDDLNALDARLTNGASAGAMLEPRSDAEREAQAAAGGRIEPVPAAIESNGADGSAVTLAELARRQAGVNAGPPAAAAGGNCASAVRYGHEWAGRMPAPFRLYPRARLGEAAGSQTELCKLRIISFTTDVPIDRVLGYYYTQAKRAGYDAEHLLVQGEHQLGGTKGDLAYVIFARGGAGGRTDVDIVANAQ